MQIDVIEEVKGTQFMQCKLYIDGKSQDSAGVLNTTNTFIEKN